MCMDLPYDKTVCTHDTSQAALCGWKPYNVREIPGQPAIHLYLSLSMTAVAVRSFLVFTLIELLRHSLCLLLDLPIGPHFPLR